MSIAGLLWVGNQTGQLDGENTVVLTAPLKVPEPLDSGFLLEASIEKPPSARSVVVSAVPQILPNALSVC